MDPGISLRAPGGAGGGSIAFTARSAGVYLPLRVPVTQQKFPQRFSYVAKLAPFHTVQDRNTHVSEVSRRQSVWTKDEGVSTMAALAEAVPPPAAAAVVLPVEAAAAAAAAARPAATNCKNVRVKWAKALLLLACAAAALALFAMSTADSGRVLVSLFG